MTWWDSEVVNIVNINTNRLTQQSAIFQKSWRHLKAWQEARAVLATHTCYAQPNGAPDSFTPWLTGTSRNSMLFEKLIDLVEKSSVFYGSRRVVTSFATFRHWQVFWSGWIKSPADSTVSLRCILTLYLLTWSIWWALNNASKGTMGFKSAFKGLILYSHLRLCLMVFFSL